MSPVGQFGVRSCVRRRVQSELKLDLESAQIGLKLNFWYVNRLMMGGSSIDKSDFIRFE